MIFTALRIFSHFFLLFFTQNLFYLLFMKLHLKSNVMMKLQVIFQRKVLRIANILCAKLFQMYVSKPFLYKKFGNKCLLSGVYIYIKRDMSERHYIIHKIYRFKMIKSELIWLKILNKLTFYLLLFNLTILIIIFILSY